MLEVVIQGRAGLSCCHVLFVMLEIFCVFHKIFQRILQTFDI